MDRNDKGAQPPLPHVSNREAKRDSLFLLTSLSLPDGQQLCKMRVRNLSATGLMADCPVPVGKGQAIVVDLRGVGSVNGTIIWAADDRVGIAFDHAINPADARKPVRQSSQAAPDYLRPLRKFR